MEEIRKYLQRVADAEGPVVAGAVGIVFVAALILSLLFNVDWLILWEALQGVLGQ